MPGIHGLFPGHGGGTRTVGSFPKKAYVHSKAGGNSRQNVLVNSPPRPATAVAPRAVIDAEPRDPATLSSPLPEDLFEPPGAVGERFLFYAYGVQDAQEQIGKRNLLGKHLIGAVLEAEVFSSGKDQRVIFCKMQ